MTLNEKIKMVYKKTKFIPINHAYAKVGEDKKVYCCALSALYLYELKFNHTRLPVISEGILAKSLKLDIEFVSGFIDGFDKISNRSLKLHRLSSRYMAGHRNGKELYNSLKPKTLKFYNLEKE